MTRPSRQVARARSRTGGVPPAGAAGHGRSRRLALGRGRGDRGSALAISLIMLALVTSGVTIALTTSAVSVEQSGAYHRSTAARLAAESGIQSTLATMRGASSYAELPACASSGALPTSAYAVSIQYFTGTTATGLTPAPCPLAAQPSRATVTSTGTSGAASAVMQASVALDDTPAPLAPFDDAIFSNTNVSMNSQATASASTGSSARADVYANGQITCTNSNIIEGNMVTYGPSGGYRANKALSLSSSCRIDGTLYVNGWVTLSNTVSVGTLEAIGGGISMNSSAQVLGNAYATGGGITMYNSSRIGGNAAAVGAVSVSTGTVGGTICQGSASCIPSSVAMPSPVPFPVVNPTTWPSSYTIVTVPSSQCSNFGSYQYPGGKVSPSAFANDVAQAPQGGTTVIDASQCGSGVTLQGASTQGNGSCPTSGMSTYTLHSNIILLVASFSDYGCNTFASASGGPYSFAIVVPDTGQSPSQGTVSLTNQTNLMGVNFLLYTPGTANFSCYNSMVGQIVAGNVYATNNFSLTASNTASQLIPGTTELSGEQVTLERVVLLSD